MPWVVVVALCSLLFAASAYSQQPAPTGDARQKKDSRTDDTTKGGDSVSKPQSPQPATLPEPQPPTPDNLKAQSDVKKGERNSQDKNGGEWNWEKWTTITNGLATLAIALFTGVLLWHTARQAEATEKSAAAAENSVKAMADSIKVQTEGEQRQLRAYVGVEDGHMNIDDPKLPPTAVLKIRNAGLTPAMDLVHRSRLDFTISKSGCPGLSLIEDRYDPRSVLLPGCSFFGRAALKEPLAPREIDMLKGGGWTIYVFGEIQYTDVYGRRQTTRYCLFSDAATGAQNPLSFGSSGNDAT